MKFVNYVNSYKSLIYFSFVKIFNRVRQNILLPSLLFFIFSACGEGTAPQSQTNVPPTANSGTHQTVEVGVNVLLDGSSSTDTDGSIVNYLWEQISGSTVVISERNTAVASFTAPEIMEPVVLEFSLTVTDNIGATDKQNVLITISTLPSTTITGKLNDTGITTCSNGVANGLICPVTNINGQDAEHGRDALTALIKIGGGKAGFDFTKLDASGYTLADSAASWSCVKDNHTGLIWEVKTTDGGLQDKNNTYSWLNLDADTSGGDVGTNNGGSCSVSDCDTKHYLDDINERELCGANDWQLPFKEQLRSIVDYNTSNVSIDAAYFPNTLPSNITWSSSPYANDSSKAWYISFNAGGDGTDSKSRAGYVRLVRSGQ